MHGAPGKCNRHEPELHEQHVSVPGRPEVVQVRQAQDAQVDTGSEQKRDEHGREHREAQKRSSA